MANLIQTSSDKLLTVVSEWNSERNGKLPESMVLYSKTKVWWTCQKDKSHIWEASINNRFGAAYKDKKPSGCPYCVRRKVTPQYNFAVLHEYLLTEWDVKNNIVDPYKILPQSHQKYWWVCKLGHRWQATLHNRVGQGHGCLECSGQKMSDANNLSITHPELLRYWDSTRNTPLTPREIGHGSTRMVWWKCSNQHNWVNSPNHLTGNKVDRKVYDPCPHCRISKNSVVLIAPDVFKEWHPTKNGTLTPERITKGSTQQIWWLGKCGHEWQAMPYNRIGNNTGCPYCQYCHTDLEKFVESKLNIQHLTKMVLKYKPDYELIPDKLYLNVDGLYWHSEANKSKDYHFKLREIFVNSNLRILQFYEDEIYNKWNIVESIINNALNKTTTKINARECKTESLNQSQANEFYNTNHLMGLCSFSNHYGLFLNKELISCISTRLTGNIMEISRFATKLNTSVRGGFSKLLKHSIKQHKPTKIISFCDLRYATGKSYEKLGFKLEHVTQGFQWTDRINRYNRLSCRASDKNTEQENAKEKNWIKIYDAGQAKYVLGVN